MRFTVPSHVIAGTFMAALAFTSPTSATPAPNSASSKVGAEPKRTEGATTNMTTARSYAAAQMRTVAPLVGVEAAEDALWLTFVAADEDTVFPAVTVGEERSVLLHWMAGSSSIEVEIDADRRAYVLISADGVTSQFSGPPRDEQLYGQLKSALRQFSEKVSQKNPRWREVFV